MEVTSYYIDDKQTLHTYVSTRHFLGRKLGRGQRKHITISNVTSDKQAMKLIAEIESEGDNEEI